MTKKHDQETTDRHVKSLLILADLRFSRSLARSLWTRFFSKTLTGNFWKIVKKIVSLGMIADFLINKTLAKNIWSIQFFFVSLGVAFVFLISETLTMPKMVWHDF